MLVNLMLVGVGSALGGISRYLMSIWIVNWVGNQFPWATLTVNVLGAIAIGFLLTLLLPDSRPHMDAWRILAMTGFLGGFTTFSTFSLETFLLLLDGKFAAALMNIVLSVGLCLMGTFLGYLACRSFAI